MVLTREGLRQAQRPGLPIVNGVARSTHAAAKAIFINVLPDLHQEAGNGSRS